MKNLKKTRLLSQAEFVKLMQKMRAGKTLRIFAAELGVSFQFLGHVFQGKYIPGPTVAQALGYEQVVAYRKAAKRKAKVKAKREKPRDKRQLTEFNADTPMSERPI